MQQPPTMKSDVSQDVSSEAVLTRKRRRRGIDRVVAATKTGGPIQRLVGTVDIDGKGILHSLEECDPCMLLEHASISQNGIPSFGAHPHRGHSVVTLLMRGTMKSWDSYSNQQVTFHAPSSYWVNAGRGLFHDEYSIIENESDQGQHAALFQLWIGVQEHDRLKTPSIVCTTNLSRETITSPDGQQEVGSIIYYVGGSHTFEVNKILPRPLIVGQICQLPNTTYHIPIPQGHHGFVVNISGAWYVDPKSRPASFAGVTPTSENDVLILDEDNDNDNDDDDEGRSVNHSGAYLEVVTGNAPSDYWFCIGEPHGAVWFKKLAASGAVVAETSDEVRRIAEEMAKVSARGLETGDFTPYGKAPDEDSVRAR